MFNTLTNSFLNHYRNILTFLISNGFQYLYFAYLFLSHYMKIVFSISPETCTVHLELTKPMLRALFLEHVYMCRNKRKNK